MAKKEAQLRRIRETLRLDRISSNWVFLLIPTLTGIFGAFIPTILPVLNINQEVSAEAQWSILCFLGGASVSLQIAIRRWIVADRELLEQKIEGIFRSYENALDLVTTYARLKRRHSNQFFDFFADEILKKAEKDMLHILQDRQVTMQAVAPSEEYVRRWGEFMDKLMVRGSTFVTVTNMEIWSRTYMGNPRSTYLQKNAAAGSDIEIKRVFVVPSSDMLERDPELLRELKEILVRYHNKLHTAPHVETRICRARTEDEYKQHFNSGGDSENFGIWKITDEIEVCLIVRYRPSRYGRFEITEITFRLDADYISQRRPAFEEKFEEGDSLEDYLAKLDEKPKTQVLRSPEPVQLPDPSSVKPLSWG